MFLEFSHMLHGAPFMHIHASYGDIWSNGVLDNYKVGTQKTSHRLHVVEDTYISISFLMEILVVSWWKYLKHWQLLCKICIPLGGHCFLAFIERRIFLVVFTKDTVELLDYILGNHVGVVKKIRAFIGRIAHKSIVDMAYMQQLSKLGDMWCGVNVLDQRKYMCD